MEWSNHFSDIIQISDHHRSFYEIPNFLYGFLYCKHQLSDILFFRTIKKDICIISIGVIHNWLQSNIFNISLHTIHKLFNLCT